jgi:hypothetical protein
MSIFTRKTWYTLTEAVDFINKNTTDNLEAQISDLYQQVANGNLTLTIRLFSNARASFGRIISPAAAEHPLPKEATLLSESPCRAGLYFLPDREELILKKGDYWNLTLFGGGADLVERRWRDSFYATSRDTDKLLPPPFDPDEPDDKVQGLRVPEPIFLKPLSQQETNWVIKLHIRHIPDDAMIGVTAEALDKLLSDAPPAQSQLVGIEGATETDEKSNQLVSLQRTLAALAKGLMKKYPAYRNGDKPNCFQIAELATQHLKNENDRPPYGLGVTTVRKLIKEAIDSNPKL